MPNLPFTYTIRRSLRSNKVRIIVTLDKVEVVAPDQVAEARIKQFVQSKQDWVLGALAKVALKNRCSDYTPVVFGNGAKITFQGDTYPLTIRATALKRVKIEFADGFIAHIPQNLPATEHHSAIKTALVGWLKKQAKQQVELMVKQQGNRHGLMPRAITIKTQKSRWGSCGIRDDIHINWLLMLAPPQVLEYVVVHELCHLRVRNHSADFWALVALHLPDYQKQRRWLKQHGAGLMRDWL